MSTPATTKVRRALPLAVRLYFEAAPGNTVLLFVMSIAEPLLSLALSVVVGVVVGQGAVAADQGPTSAAAGRVMTGLVLAGGILLGQGAIRAANPGVTLMQVSRVSFRNQQRALAAALGATGVRHLEDAQFMDKLDVALGRDWSVGQTVYSVFGLLPSVVHLVGASLILVGFRWWAPIVVLICMVVQYRWANRGASSVFRAGVENATPDRRRAVYFRNLAVEAAAAKEVRIFGLPEWIGGRFAQHWRHGLEPIWRERRRTRLLSVVPLAATVASSGLIFLVLADAAVAGTVSVTATAIYAQQALALFGLSSQFFDGQYLLALGLHAAETLDALPERAAAGQPRSGSRAATRHPATAIRFEDVTFSYPQSGMPVFDGLNLEVPAGQSLAIVGQNGAGKTTLVKLLCRLYDPGSGRITIDGVDLREFDLDDWRERTAVIFQDFVRYEVSLTDNLAFGRMTEHRAGGAELAPALQLAGGGDLPQTLPNGWDTILSRAYAGGAELSGGQWQKVALARALVRASAGGVLILDEPTANLDVRSEADLFNRFLEITGRDRGGPPLTTLLISHRFSTVRRADRICVLDGGVVVEDGTHDTLIARGGRYAEMFNLQADRFSDEGGERPTP